MHCPFSSYCWLTSLRNLLQFNIVWAIIDPINFHYNIVSNILGIAHNKFAISLCPPYSSTHFIICFTQFVCHFACMLLPFFSLYSTHIATSYRDDVLRTPQSVHVYDLQKFVYGIWLVRPLPQCLWVVSLHGPHTVPPLQHWYIA